ncbi:hypothetical protein PENTCL1PPCAC_7507, partial [Pristionchus entomophagus]
MSGPLLPLFVIHSLLCGSSVFGNLLLMTLIFSHTPPTNRSYSVLIISMSLLELVTSATSFALFQRLIPCGSSLFLVSTGPAILAHSRRLCFVLYAVMMHGHAHYICMMALLFCFRYYVLIKPTPRSQSVALICLLFYVPTAMIFGVLADSDIAPEAEILEKMNDTLGYDLRGDIVTGYSSIFEPRVTLAVVWVTAPSGSFAWIIIFLGSRIHRKLKRRTHSMSETTRLMHRELMQALSVQASLTVVFALSVLTYLLMQFNLVHGEAIEYSTHMLGEVCLACSPIVTIYYVRSYRRAVTSCSICRKRIVAPPHHRLDSEMPSFQP